MTTVHASPVAPRRYPFSAVFSPFPLVCFTLALFTDIAYWQTSYLMWQNFSAWLLFAGLVFGALAVLCGIVDLVRPRTRGLRPSFLSAIVFLLVLFLALVNSLVHAGDGWTAVVPLGLALSAATVLFAILAAWLNARHRAAVFWRVP